MISWVHATITCDHSRCIRRVIIFRFDATRTAVAQQVRATARRRGWYLGSKHWCPDHRLPQMWSDQLGDPRAGATASG